MISKIYQNFILSKPKIILSLLILIAVFFGYQSKDFRLDASSETLILDNDVDYQIYEQTNDDFGSSDFLILAIQSSNEIFTLDNLQNLQNLSQYFKELQIIAFQQETENLQKLLLRILKKITSKLKTYLQKHQVVMRFNFRKNLFLILMRDKD